MLILGNLIMKNLSFGKKIYFYKKSYLKFYKLFAILSYVLFNFLILVILLIKISRNIEFVS